MPFRSIKQRSYLWAAADRGDIPKSVPREFAAATPPGLKLPLRAVKTRLPTRGTGSRSSTPRVPSLRKAAARKV